jgi:hypothetical protein
MDRVHMYDMPTVQTSDRRRGSLRVANQRRTLVITRCYDSFVPEKTLTGVQFIDEH